MKVGDKVRLKSGGPVMVVSELPWFLNYKIVCVWFDAAASLTNGKDKTIVAHGGSSLCFGEFYPECLEKVETH